MEIKFSSSTTKFENIGVGEVCNIAGEYYLAVEEIYCEEGEPVNAINLKTGYAYHFEYDKPAKRVRTTLIVED